MKAIIEVEFLEVNGRKVAGDVEKVMGFKSATARTVKKICKGIDEQFKSVGIKVKTKHKIE